MRITLGKSYRPERVSRTSSPSQAVVATLYGTVVALMGSAMVAPTSPLALSAIQTTARPKPKE